VKSDCEKHTTRLLEDSCKAKAMASEEAGKVKVLTARLAELQKEKVWITSASVCQDFAIAWHRETILDKNGRSCNLR
jgi:hypothetical protein